MRFRSNHTGTINGLKIAHKNIMQHGASLHSYGCSVFHVQSSWLRQICMHICRLILLK